MERKRFGIDLHGHTFASDGLSSNSRIIRATYKAGLDVVPVTDHETTQGVYSMVAEVARFNEINDANVEVFRGIEFCTIFKFNQKIVRADIVAGHFGPNDDFLRWAELHQSNHPDTVDTIIRAVSDYGALVIIPHAGLDRANSVPIPLLPYLFDQIDEVTSAVALEVENSSGNAYGGAAQRRRERIQFAEERGIAPVGNSDRHHDLEIGRVYTIFEMEKLTQDSVLEAIASKNTLVVSKRNTVASAGTAFVMVSAFFNNAWMMKKWPLSSEEMKIRKQMSREYLASIRNGDVQ